MVLDQALPPEGISGPAADSKSIHDGSDIHSSLSHKALDTGYSSIPDFQDLALDPLSHMNATPLFSVAPPPPYNLIMEDLTIGVPSSTSIPLPSVLKKRFTKPATDSEPKTIVREVSATCANGEMLVIIGASGSGKTTVLNAIVGRLANLPIDNGSVFYSPSSAISAADRTPLSARTIKQRIGFVKQQDTLLEHLTVRETLMFAAALRLPQSVSKETRELIVNHTIEELGLRDAANTIIGGVLRKGISGGERRRLSIGCALVSLPSVLVADEPTTGLDAYTAYSILLTLSRLAHRQSGSLTVICTLHQPRSATFPLFDRILLLSKGRVVYSGPQATCLPWFQNVDDAFAPGRGTNPMDWLIDISTVDPRPEMEDESRERVERLVDAWKDDGERYVVDHSKPRQEVSRREGGRSLPPIGPSENSAPRDASRTRSEVEQILDVNSDDSGRIGPSVFLGIIFGLVFYQVPEVSFTRA
ncbi:hypothetical protein FRB96_001237 [Tulasnella sp. 330]|nr:hypothetical protein FRB96_001237 [Tulasnella sp. 330]